MDQDNRLEEALAAFTDNVLEEQDVEFSGEMQDMERIVMALDQLIDPHSGPDAAFRARLNRTLNDEWAVQQRQQRIRQVQQQRLMRYGAAAAALVIVIAAALVISDNGDSPTATSAGDDNTLIYLSVGIVAALAVFYAYMQFRRRD